MRPREPKPDGRPSALTGRGGSDTLGQGDVDRRHRHPRDLQPLRQSATWPSGIYLRVGYNLAYAGGAPLVSVNVAVLFPDSFAAHVTPETVDRAIGWQPAAAGLSSPAIHDAAWLSRLGGTMGAICRSGPADLDSLRGTLLKVSWETIEGSYEQEFQIDEIKAEMTACGAEDGRIRIVWADPRSC